MVKEKIEKDEAVNPAELPVPEELPILPIHGFVFFPGMGFPLQVKSESSKKLVDEAILKDHLIGIVSHKKLETKNEPIKQESLYQVGVVGYIHKLIKGDGDSYQILVSAVKRIRIHKYIQEEPYLQGRLIS